MCKKLPPAGFNRGANTALTTVSTHVAEVHNYARLTNVDPRSKRIKI